MLPHRLPAAMLGAALMAAALGGCFIVPEAVPDETTDAAASTPGSSTPPADCRGSGLPAPIEAMLRESCQGCHGASPSAPMSLVDHADLVAPAPSDPSKSVAEVTAERITAAANPMPPGDGPTVEGDRVDALRQWIADGMPQAAGSCPEPAHDGAASEPAPSVCTSQTTWNPGRERKGGDDDDDDWKGPRMNPGRACIGCHVESGEGQIVQVGGTVYPTLHEPDLCFGMGREVGAKVVITDAEGTVVELPVGDTGNFAHEDDDLPTLRFPIRAKVVSSAGVREMRSPQNTGDCNSCHSEHGRNGAPGRILLP